MGSWVSKLGFKILTQTLWLTGKCRNPLWWYLGGVRWCPRLGTASVENPVREHYTLNGKGEAGKRGYKQVILDCLAHHIRHGGRSTNLGGGIWFKSLHLIRPKGGGGQIAPLPPGSAGPAHIVEARPDPLNIGGSVGTRKQLELKMYLRGPQGNQITVVAFQHVCTFGARFIFTKKSNVAKYFFDICNAEIAQSLSSLRNQSF